MFRSRTMGLVEVTHSSSLTTGMGQDFGDEDLVSWRVVAFGKVPCR